MNEIKLNVNENTVLEWLENYTAPKGDMCCGFAPMVKDMGLEQAVIRRACRSLKRKGLAEFYTGLSDDDGFAGAGYCVSEAGQTLINKKKGGV